MIAICTRNPIKQTTIARAGALIVEGLPHRHDHGAEHPQRWDDECRNAEPGDDAEDAQDARRAGEPERAQHLPGVGLRGRLGQQLGADVVGEKRPDVPA